jgi:hypothetical protein
MVTTGFRPVKDGLATLPALGLKTTMQVTIAGLRDQVTALGRGAPYYIPAAAPPGCRDATKTDKTRLATLTRSRRVAKPCQSSLHDPSHTCATPDHLLPQARQSSHNPSTNK